MHDYPESARRADHGRNGQVQLQFGDAQEQASALVGWNQDYLQLGAGPFQGTLHLAQAPGIRLFVEQLHQPVLQDGALPRGVLALGVPLQAAGTGVFCGTACGADTLHVFSGAAGFEFRSSPRHAMLGIEVQLAPADAVHTADDGASPPPRAGGWHMPQPLASQVRSQMRALFESACRHPEVFGQAPVRAAATDFLLQAMASAGIGASGLRNTNTCNHWALVQQARALARAQHEQPLTVAQLCQTLGVSRRTLQNGFQQVLGIGPLAYLKAMRLRQARHALQQGAAVSEAATACGFWHFGHFARDYASMFGERPSETLRRPGAWPAPPH